MKTVESLLFQRRSWIRRSREVKTGRVRLAKRGRVRRSHETSKDRSGMEVTCDEHREVRYGGHIRLAKRGRELRSHGTSKEKSDMEVM